MIMDKNTTFCDALAVDSAAGTTLEGDVIDLGAASLNPGAGQPLYLVIQVTTAFTSGGSATVAFVLASDAQAAIATNGAATEHYLTEAIPVASLVVGYKRIIALPQGVDYERYLGVLVTTAAATTTAGSISAFLTWDVQNNRSYPEAVN